MNPEQIKQEVREKVEIENAFRCLNNYGVPKTRAITISKGIDVLVNRMDKEIYFLKAEIKRKNQAIDEVIKDINDNRIVAEKDYIYFDEIIQIIKDKLKEK